MHCMSVWALKMVWNGQKHVRWKLKKFVFYHYNEIRYTEVLYVFTNIKRPFRYYSSPEGIPIFCSCTKIQIYGAYSKVTSVEIKM